MVGAVFLGAGGAVFVVLGLVAALPRANRRGARAPWAAVAFGGSQLCHAAGMLAGDGGAAGVVLSTCTAAFAVCGALLVWADSRAARRSRRRLPPLDL
jgi:hypothetical protein